MISDLLGSGAGGQERQIHAISLWQPWATWVAWGWKKVETRLHARFACLAGKDVGIHAARVWDKNAITLARPFLTREQIERTYQLLQSGDCPHGAVVAIVSIKEHRLTEPNDCVLALIECQTPRYGLFISEVAPVEPPFSCKGRQGIFPISVPSR